MEGSGWVSQEKNTRKERKQALDAIHLTIFALMFSEAVVLPSLSSYLAAFHAESSVLGFCLAAYCIGEICFQPLFSAWYNVGTAKHIILVSLAASSFGGVLYALASSPTLVVISRLVVGCAAGLQGALWHMIGGLTPREDRYQAVTAAKSMQTIALVLGTGMAAVATFVHTPLPGRLGHIDHTLPKYVKMMHLGNATARMSSEINSLGSLGGMVIPPDGTSHHRKLLSKTDAVERLHSLRSKLRAKPDSVHHQHHDPPSTSEQKSTAHKKNPSHASGNDQTSAQDPDQAASQEIRTASKDLGKASSAVTKTVTKDLSTLNKNMQNMGTMTRKDLGVNGIKVAKEDADRQDGVKTDKQIAKEIGDHRMYMPQYLTAVVGHGLEAPGYIGALVALATMVYVWRTMDAPYQSPTDHVPISHLNPRSMALFTPMVACLAMETLVQIWISSVETIVAPISGIYLGFTIDATAVFMMGIPASGVVGLALVEPLKKIYSLRALMLYSCAIACLGVLLCIPWFGHLAAWQYAMGCYTCAMGFYPLSSMATQVFAKGVARTNSEQSVAWLQLYWSVTSIPARIIVPVTFAYALQFDQSASLCYIALLLCSLVALALLVLHRRALQSTQADEDPATPSSLTGGSVPFSNSVSNGYGSFVR